MVGIVLALIMRGIFIAVGAGRHRAIRWIFYIFGPVPRSTQPWKLTKEGAENEDEYEENRMVPLRGEALPGSEEWHGLKIFTVENGKRLITPMVIVILALGTTDLLFALDSIPAIYGLT